MEEMIRMEKRGDRREERSGERRKMRRKERRVDLALVGQSIVNFLHELIHSQHRRSLKIGTSVLWRSNRFGFPGESEIGAEREEESRKGGAMGSEGRTLVRIRDGGGIRQNI